MTVGTFHLEVFSKHLVFVSELFELDSFSPDLGLYQDPEKKKNILKNLWLI